MWHVIKDRKENCSIIGRYSLMTHIPIFFNAKTILCGAACLPTSEVFPLALDLLPRPPAIAPASYSSSHPAASFSHPHSRPAASIPGSALRPCLRRRPARPPNSWQDLVLGMQRRQSGRRPPRHRSSSPVPPMSSCANPSPAPQYSVHYESIAN
jgi:hypothetical protein